MERTYNVTFESNSPRGCTSKSMFARDNPPTPTPLPSSVDSVSHVWHSLAKKAPVATCHCVRRCIYM